MRSVSHVIASEAKQSILLPRKVRWIASSLSLLAMTGIDNRPHLECPLWSTRSSKRVTQENDVSGNATEADRDDGLLGHARSFRRKLTYRMGRRQPAGRSDRLLHRRAVVRQRRQSLHRRHPVRPHFPDLARQDGSEVVGYDGWPNGLKVGRDGRILVADYRHGIMELDARAGRMRKVLTSRNSESFGLQRSAPRRQWRYLLYGPGATDLHDPTGRVYRLKTDGRLDCLINTGISPNGLALDPAEAVLFVGQ